jgi:FkbM family methyltransferase
MQVLRFIPKFLRKHKIIELVCRLKLHNRLDKCEFNNRSNAFIDLLDPEPRNVYIRRKFDSDFFEIASTFLSPNCNFFDLGANHGLCTFGLLPKHSTVDFHLFEANESLLEIIKMSTTLHPDSLFFLNHGCIADKIGHTTFHLESNQSGQSHVATRLEKGIEIKNLVLDDYCDEKKLSNIAFAKIDLEGHELAALRGWKKYLKKHQVNAIYIEIMPENQNRYNLKTNEPLLFLESLGYDLFLCKEDDFTHFGEHPKEYEFETKTLILSKFQAKKFPENFATDVLALTPENHQS